MSSAPEEASTGRHRVGSFERYWTVFAVTWAAAVLFHLAGNTRLAPNWGRALLGLAALAVLARPRDPRVAVPLAFAVLANVWLEAPVLGNHWLLHGFLAVLVLAAVAPSPTDPGRAAGRLLGPARLLLLAFYLFAAFAKLNGDFFDPAVSCAYFYLGESAESWGVVELVDWLPAAGRRLFAVVVAGVELAVPVLLVLRRTRTAGVVLALSFHFVVGIDRSHQFFDFSSILMALFVLFLPPDAISSAERQVGRLHRWLRDRWASGPELLRLGGLAALGLIVLIASGPDTWPAPPVLRHVGVVLWLVYGILGIVVVDRARRATVGSSPSRLVPPGTPRWLLVIPAVAVLNGLAPYLELKSQAGWNMYANLSVVDGESNHLVVRSGLSVTDAHARLVELVDTTERELEFYVGTQWRLAEVQLEDHIAGRPEAVVVGLVDGERVVYRGSEVDARPMWQQKFQVFRAVDAEGPVSCQPSFGPAR